MTIVNPYLFYSLYRCSKYHIMHVHVTTGARNALFCLLINCHIPIIYPVLLIHTFVLFYLRFVYCTDATAEKLYSCIFLFLLRWYHWNNMLYLAVEVHVWYLVHSIHKHISGVVTILLHVYNSALVILLWLLLCPQQPQLDQLSRSQNNQQ